MAENPISNNNNSLPTSPTSPTTNATAAQPVVVTLRLLISHNLMGTVIGRQGAKIKHIQDISGVRMTASKTLLPQSTERVVEVRGTVEAIEQAVSEIGQCLIEDKDRAYGTILYSPTKAAVSSTSPTADRRTSITRTGNGTDFSPSMEYEGDQSRRRSSSFALLNNPDVRTQHISIPSDMVGCIIGKGGSKISEIRRLSGSHISIAKVPHDESGERMFTIQGTPDANERALYLLYGQLENEKERRLRGVITEDILEEE
jgi:heterogeneous nuclear rnp K-like protein 2